MMRILVADDSEMIRELISRVLIKSGHTIVGEAKTGKDTETKWRELKPDLLILDLVMPDKNGFETLTSILSRDPEAKIMVLTGLGQKEVEKEVRSRGAVNFLAKPFSMKELIGEIARICEN